MTAPTPTPISGRIGDDNARARNRSHQHFQDVLTGDGTTTRFPLSHTPRDTTQMHVYVNGARLRPQDRGTAYDFTLDGSVLVLTSAPGVGVPLIVDLVI